MAGRSRTAAALVPAAVLATLLVGCGGSADGGSAEGRPSELTGTRLDPPFEVSDTPLQDTSGAPYSLTEDTDAPVTLVFFGYTHCPDICGQVMATMAGAMTRLSEADRERVDVVFVTTDPERDDAETVAAYTEQFDPEFLGLTGDLDDIVSVARSVAIGVEEGEPLDSDGDGKTDGYDVTHGTQVVGVTADDKAPVFWNADVSQAQLADDIHALVDGT